MPLFKDKDNTAVHYVAYNLSSAVKLLLLEVKEKHRRRICDRGVRYQDILTLEDYDILLSKIILTEVITNACHRQRKIELVASISFSVVNIRDDLSHNVI